MLLYQLDRKQILSCLYKQNTINTEKIIFFITNKFLRATQSSQNSSESLHSGDVWCYLQPTIMDKSLATLLHFWAFSNSHRPNPSLHSTNNVGHVYPELFLSFNIVQGGGRENSKKNSKRMHCFMRKPRMKEKYEYCITVPRTFAHYCSFDRAAKLFHISQILDLTVQKF